MEFFQKNKALFNSAILSSIYNLSSLGIAIFKLNGIIIETNQALQSMLGYSNEEIIIIGLERISIKEELKKEIILFNQ
ncbi:MAG TPA: PAS domain-containing protein, partial [Candidatus Kapabacteria bacterium]|nr:PAS domain-containing protein [Candidatus Kapabacteria bacterium]